jgi:hypothetical protein
MNNWALKGDVHNKAYDFPATDYDKEGKDMFGRTSMRVWIIFQHDIDTNFVMSVWTNQTQAEREQERLQRLHPESHIWIHTECTKGA